jgi:mono/diheme cytochrome c family protein
LPSFATIIATAAAVLANTAAFAVDLHQYWDGHCVECHGHAGDFARRFLSVKDGVLRGRHHQDNLRVFLANHYLDRDLIGPVMNMLLVQAQSEPQFKARCAGCHGAASEFARASLNLRDGILVGIKTDRPVAEFLRRHAGVQPGEIEAFVDTLTRVKKETTGR